MSTLTTRVYKPLNEALEKVSNMTGIIKSNLILYAINDRLQFYDDFKGLEYRSLDTDVDSCVRFTLRIPEHLKKLLQETAKSNNISMTSLINECIYSVNAIYWSNYSK